MGALCFAKHCCFYSDGEFKYANSLTILTIQYPEKNCTVNLNLHTSFPEFS